jgi:hypothetical protein
LLKARTVEPQNQLLLANGSETTFVSGQRLGEHVSAATDTHETLEVLLETVFSIRSVQKGLQGGQLKQDEAAGREPPFRKYLRVEAGESPLLKAVTRERLERTQ